MNKHEIEFRVVNLQREAQDHALLKEIRTTESKAMLHALSEILSIFKHWTLGGAPVTNTRLMP